MKVHQSARCGLCYQRVEASTDISARLSRETARKELAAGLFMALFEHGRARGHDRHAVQAEVHDVRGPLAGAGVFQREQAWGGI